MKRSFGMLPDGQEASLYTITRGGLTACVTDYGATLVQLWVPDKHGTTEDVVLGCDDVTGYVENGAFLGATVGRNANRIRNASFPLNGTKVQLPANEKTNNLHSGPDSYAFRLWQLERQTEDSLTFRLESPHGDQGFPGKATIRVTYTLEAPGSLRIEYLAVSDRDTVFNLTNHSYFNLAGHPNGKRAMEQQLILPGRFFNPDDAENIPTGELRSVADSPMDFRAPKPIGRDIGADYEPLHLQGGYDHNFEVFCQPCAILSDPNSGREMAVTTDCPGIQFYSGNFLDTPGKNGVHYSPRTGVALETQFYPDSVNHPEWPQPFTKAGQLYKSVTIYKFS